MRRSYASGYARKSRREPSLGWFVIGALVIGGGYMYISGLGESDLGGGGVADVAEGGGGNPKAGGTGVGEDELDGEVVRQAVPVVDEGPGPVSGSVWRAGSQMVMAWVPGGSYMVRTGAGVETKSFESGFWMAVRPVSEADYEEVMGTNPVPEGKRDPKAPVTRVGWEEAKKFAGQLTARERNEGKLPENYEYRLPSEEMWEYVVGGGEDGASLRVRDDDSRDLTWWRLNGIKEFQDSQQEGSLRVGSLDVGVVCEWTVDPVESGHGTMVVRGAPHTAFLGREEEVVKSRYTIYHRDERLPFLGFRLVLVKTGADRAWVDGGGRSGGGLAGPVEVRALKPGETVDYVKRPGSFNLEELFEPSRHSRDSALTKYNILRKVQVELHRYGYYTAKVDGYPGKSTQKAIDQFQAVAGLPKTGLLDDMTLESLGLGEEEDEAGGSSRTASRTEPPSLPQPMSVPEPPERDPASADDGGRTRTSGESGSAPATPEEALRGTTRTRGANPAPPSDPPAVARSHPRAFSANPQDPSRLPRAIPVRTGVAPQPSAGYTGPERELRYDGFRGKLRQLSDTLSGTYDPSEDRR